MLRPEVVRALVLARPAWVLESAPANMRPNAVVGDLLRRYPPAEACARFEESDRARQLEAEAPDNLASLRGFFAREPAAVTSELLLRIAADGPGVAAQDVAALRDILAAELGVPVAVENDGIAAAYGEWQYGAGALRAP